MEKNYYHVKLNKGDNVSYPTPPAKGRNTKQLANGIYFMTYATGDELIQVDQGDRIDIYASFPIDIEQS